MTGNGLMIWFQIPGPQVLLACAGAMAALLAPLALSLFTPDPAVTAALQGHEAELPASTGGWADALVAIIPKNAVASARAM